MIEMPPAKTASVNGLTMTYYEAGPRQGIPVILCHGFPELAFSWRHQIKALADAGRWVIAPDQRGYGGTAGPLPVEEYDMEHLTADLVGLLDHLGREKAIWVGHDWGGIVAWQMPLMRAERTAGVIGLNTPFLPRRPMDPIEFFKMAFGPDMYIVHFQTPGEADEILARDVDKTMRFFMRKPPGLSGDHFTRPSEGARPSFALVNMVAAYQPAADRRGEFLDQEELAVFVDAFTRTGFTGGINWYRNFTRNWRRSEHLEQKVRQPCLMIMAEHDAVLPPSLADGMEEYVPDLEKVFIEGSGHWTQQEKPAEVNAAMIDWLNRRFPD
ncbi:MAG TPA: alpha/beta hydrolase [Caulobacteraceae bacterium]|nr:alpha/beta hydrolase [Caulobacteraceae bacterium]